MDRDEESQDVDITILPENEQPRHPSDCSDTLPNFQFLDGCGAAQNCADKTVEGFVALKMTYDHVFKKQQDMTRLLQQKNQQLAAEIQLLKEEMKGSRYHSEMEPQNASDLKDLAQSKSDQNPNQNLEESLSVNTFSPSIPTLQKLASSYRLIDLIKCHRSISGSRIQNTHLKDKYGREKFQDEDMYGPEKTVGENNFSQYNLERLCVKLMKLQEFPAKYQGTMEHTSASLGSSSVAQSRLTTGRRSDCFVGVHNIKVPPTDLSEQVISERDDSVYQPAVYCPESPVTGNNIAVSCNQDSITNYPSLTMPITSGTKRSTSSGISGGNISFEQACGPPSLKETTQSKESSIPDLSFSVSSRNSSSEVKGSDKKQRECEDINGVNDTAVISQVPPSQNLYPARCKNTKIKKSQQVECTLLKCPQLLGFDKIHDHVAEDVPQLECPVCSQKFPTDTSEDKVTSHVNLHFDEKSKDSHSFEILNDPPFY